MSRTAHIIRETKETQIKAALNLDGTGKSSLDTGIAFFDHMLDGFARHGLFDLELSCHGDLQVDAHHTVEDTGIVLGSAIREAAGDKKGIRRYGYFMKRWLYAPLIYPAGRIWSLMHRFRGLNAGKWTRRWQRNFFMQSAMPVP